MLVLRNVLLHQTKYLGSIYDKGMKDCYKNNFQKKITHFALHISSRPCSVTYYIQYMIFHYEYDIPTSTPLLLKCQRLLQLTYETIPNYL